MKLTKKQLTWIYLIIIGVCLIYSFVHYTVFVPLMNSTYQLDAHYFYMLVIVPLLNFSVMGCITIRSGLTMTKISTVIKSSLRFLGLLIVGIHVVFIILFYLRINFFPFNLIVLNYMLLVNAFSYVFGICAVLINMDKYSEEN